MLSDDSANRVRREKKKQNIKTVFADPVYLGERCKRN
jgi:hypothetical protein